MPLGFAGLLLVACGGASTPEAAPASEPAASSTATPAASSPAAAVEATSDGAADVAVPAALQFTAPLLGGGDIELTTLAGRPVLLWFWAPW